MKITPSDYSKLFQLRDVACMISAKGEEDEQKTASTPSSPYFSKLFQLRDVACKIAAKEEADDEQKTASIPSSPDFSKLFQLRDVACTIAAKEEDDEQKTASTPSSCRRPCKKKLFRSSEEEYEKPLHGWVESVMRMCGALSSSPLTSGQKQLTNTDVRSQGNRLLFPLAVREALSREMREWEKRKADEAEGLPVNVVDRVGRKHRVALANWPKNHWIVLKGQNYRRFVKANELEAKLEEKHRQQLELTIGIWVFRDRVDDALCFALVDSE
ncbi:hypothetical protein H6P81_019744 [Aristolochia fimbriata]|uniref:Uncharacterized protein n=1 Tax=Aristolochia fimbriata TaxID=158543 RepID=A0AAV7DSV4_ARIFI|nr:hypothetical protein H6P81_019744 [Aristolochia fimbriata]